MKYKIEKENGITRIFDSKGNKVYSEDSDGDGVKRKFDNKGNKVYHEDSNGDIWAVDPGKNKIIEAKDLDECLEKLKEVKK